MALPDLFEGARLFLQGVGCRTDPSNEKFDRAPGDRKLDMFVYRGGQFLTAKDGALSWPGHQLKDEVILGLGGLSAETAKAGGPDGWNRPFSAFVLPPSGVSDEALRGAVWYLETVKGESLGLRTPQGDPGRKFKPGEDDAYSGMLWRYSQKAALSNQPEASAFVLWDSPPEWEMTGREATEPQCESLSGNDDANCVTPLFMKPLVKPLEIRFDGKALLPFFRAQRDRILRHDRIGIDDGICGDIPYDVNTRLTAWQSGKMLLLRARLVGKLADGRIIYIPIHVPIPIRDEKQ